MSDENFIFVDFFTVKADGNDVNPGICGEVFYIDRYLAWRHFRKKSISKKVYEDEISNSKKVYEDEIFGRQDTLQFFSRESKDYKISVGLNGNMQTLSNASDR